MADKKTSASGRTGLDLSHEKIVQFGLVVHDAEKVAKCFSEIFGVSWKLYDMQPGKIQLRDKALGDADCRLKIAIGVFGGRTLKLVQPVSGQNSYAEFLRKQGEGFYTIGLGVLANHDQIASALRKAGVSIEMQGDLGNGSRFSILDTADDLGCRFEISSPADQAGESRLIQIGTLVPGSAAYVDMDEPIFSGGKKINQVGFVVGDEKRAAKRFEELMGIGNWSYAYGPLGLVNASLNEEPVPESAMESLDVAFAMGWLGDIQIEIIRPIGIRPGGCHQRFLDKHGNGIQHVSFGVQEEYSAIVGGLKKAGIGTEFATSIKDHSVSVSYFATQSQLGGFQLEAVGRT